MQGPKQSGRRQRNEWDPGERLYTLSRFTFMALKYGKPNVTKYRRYVITT